ncbi:NAD(+) diphosphatase [Nocardioides guangzhouensis]|uniref:NAD(+) diphosphatase n=1 Tax=Nocardioides guangzhouensis TaxID=2497878 RepID=A0A4Q4ZHH7_9ACTN|nr:NAD(+) diphosphatase [Nocardioides guangzhouensis]RYP87697.1 NAD(+) diphosphatase [Nocardioides guangzhouensis]
MSFPHLDLAANAHDRAGVRRVDADWLAARWADPETRVLVVAGTRLRPVDGAPDWRPSAEVPDGTRVLLGERGGRTWFAVLVDPAEAPGERGDWVGLRAVLPRFAAGVVEEAPLLFHAIGMAEWHWATRHCPRCGGRLEPRSAGHELRCPDCGKAQFPRTDPAVIMAVTHGDADDEAILLGRQHSWPEGRYSTLAGFCEPGETLEDAVRREVMEEVGVPVGEVTYFGNQPWPLPASLMLGFTARALTRDVHVDGEEIETARWFTRAEMKAALDDGSVMIPAGVSISSSLLEHWYGARLVSPGW